MTEIKVEWLGTPFAARLGEGAWLGGCIRTRDPGPPVYLNEVIKTWAFRGELARPRDPVHQVLLDASIYGGLLLFYEYESMLVPISRRLVNARLGFSARPPRQGTRRSLKAVMEAWAALTARGDVSWLDGLQLEYPAGLVLSIDNGGLEAPCVYIEYI